MSTTTYSRLGATAVTANTDTQLYVVPAATSAVISSIFICNTGSTLQTFRVAVCPGAIASVVIQDYIYYDISINGNDTFIATVGITMATTNTILVRSNSTNVVFSVFGSSIT